MTDHIDLLERAHVWISADPDETTRAELAAIIEQGDWDELSDRLSGVLEFGTAGIRGRVEAGSNRMNRAVVIRTTAGLSDFLLAERHGPVVVGFDGRSSSHQFADDVIGVFAAAGHQVHYFADPTPTPLVAFAARQFDAAAAVVVTASHNPPADNGYKVYDSNAAQIVPPVDREISEAIARVGPAAAVPRIAEAMSGTTPRAVPIDADGIYAAYRRQVDDVRTRTTGSDLAIAYTPIHGVGWGPLDRLFRDAGYTRVRVVEAQRDPDGRFPTVAFPNPEEPGAMDLVLQLGDRIDADLVVANDPDADRLAVAIPAEDGSWQPLTGNQVGVLIADWLLEHWELVERPIVINSIVSSPMLATVAASHNARFEQTLTGFKWIANAALDLEAAGEGRFCCGYEEALGYSVGRVVRDKDGISAALVFADMAATLAEAGSSVRQRLEDLYRRAGLWVSTQLSVVRAGADGLAEIDAAMAKLGDSRPQALGGRQLVAAIDYRTGAEERPRWLGETPLVAWMLEDGGRVLVRPSGTEPKLKIYVDLPGEGGAEPAEAERSLTETAGEIADEAGEFIGLGG